MKHNFKKIIKLRHLNKIFFNKINLEVYSFEESTNLLGFLRKLQRKGITIQTVYDIGAHKGLWTKNASKILTKSKFYLFEPNEIHNKELDAIGYSYFNCLLGDIPGRKVNFYAAGQTGDSYFKEKNPIYDDSTKKQMVLNTLDYFQETEGIPKPNLIKIDTQGSELLILKGALNLLKEVSIIIIELAVTNMNIGAPNFSDVVKFLEDHDFVPVQLVEVHKVINILVQIDIAFMNRKLFIEIFGHDDIYHRSH